MAEVRSGSFRTTGYSDPGWPDHYVFSWELTSQSIEGNYSDIKWSLTARGTNVASANYFTNVREKYVTVNGTTKSNSTLQATYNGTTPFSGTARIYHNSLGAASFSASAGGAFFYYGSYNSTGSGTWDLPTIQRATTPVLATTNITMGASVNITLTPENSTFKHKIRYDFGTVTGSAEGISIGYEFTAQGNTSVTFTPPTSLGSQIPNTLSGKGKIICYTYKSDGTHIGTKSVDVTLNVPSYSIEGKVSYTSNNTLNGAYVQNKSYINVETTVTSNLYGATIKSYKSTIDGVEYSGAKFTTKTFSPGSKSVSVIVTDSRNKTATLSVTGFTVYAYSIPNITQFTLARQADGTTVIATVKGNISAVNNQNAKTVAVTLNGVTKTVTPSAYTINENITFTGVSTDQTFSSKAVFADSYISIDKDAILPTVAVTMDFYKDGNGIAMGKVAEKGNLLEVTWDVETEGNLKVEKNADIMGNFSVAGDFTLGGKNLFDYTKSKFGWGKNTVLYNSQTVANSVGNTITGASVTLEANSTYLVMVGVMVSDGAQTSFSDILLAGVEAGTGGEILISCSGRGGAYAGGGVCGFGIVKTTSSTFVRCQSHGYKSGTFNLYMRTIAIKLDT